MIQTHKKKEKKKEKREKRDTIETVVIPASLSNLTLTNSIVRKLISSTRYQFWYIFMSNITFTNLIWFSDDSQQVHPIKLKLTLTNQAM